MAEAVTKHLEGDRSVDFLRDRHGKWRLIDMAEGALSYRNEAEFHKLDLRHRKDNSPEIG